MAERKKMGEDGSITSSELEYILEVNKKAVEISVEVAKQNENIIQYLDNFEGKLSSLIDNQKEHLNTSKNGMTYITENKKSMEEIKIMSEEDTRSREALAEEIEEIKEKVDDIDKNLFRLVIILGSAGIGALITLIQAFLHK